MLSERDIELAHPEAFDFVFGNLRSDKRAEFDRHLPGCRHCQRVVDEYREIGAVIKLVPLDVEPSADLEERTVAAMVTAVSEEERTTTERSPDDGYQAATRTDPIPHEEPSAEDGSQLRPALAAPQARPVVTHLPVWRRHQGRLAAAAAAAAVIIAAIVIPLSRSHGPTAPTQATVVIPLHATAAAKAFGVGTAAGQATARRIGGNWTLNLNVHGLRPLPGNDVYMCWTSAPGSTTLHPLLAISGSFIVGDPGSVTLTITTGIDPRQFSTMEITAEPPGNGALHGAVLLTGRSTTT